MIKKRLIILGMVSLGYFSCVNNVVESLEEDCLEVETFYVEAIAPIMSQYCVGCHSGVAPSGGLMLDSFNSVYGSMALNLERVNREQGSLGFMPSGGNKLSDEEIASLQSFLEMDCE
ncbi:MAG: c-type cytochrome [Candidatus Neomarinimicrobiota bacterium]